MIITTWCPFKCSEKWLQVASRFTWVFNVRSWSASSSFSSFRSLWIWLDLIRSLISLKLASSFSRSCCMRRMFCSCMSSKAWPVTSISLSSASSSCAEQRASKNKTQPRTSRAAHSPVWLWTASCWGCQSAPPRNGSSSEPLRLPFSCPLSSPSPPAPAASVAAPLPKTRTNKMLKLVSTCSHKKTTFQKAQTFKHA